MRERLRKLTGFHYDARDASVLVAQCGRVNAAELDLIIDRGLVRLARYLRQPIGELEQLPLWRYTRFVELMVELIEAENGKRSNDVLALPLPDDEG